MSLTAKTASLSFVQEHLDRLVFLPGSTNEIHLVMCDKTDQRMARYRHTLSVLREICSLRLIEKFGDKARSGETYQEITKPALLVLPHIAWTLSGEAVSSASSPAIAEVLQLIDLGAAEKALKLMASGQVDDPLIAGMLAFVHLDFDDAEFWLKSEQADYQDYRVPYTRAIFSTARGQIAVALVLIKEVEKLKVPPVERAQAACHKALLLSLIGQVKEVVPACDTAVELCRELAESDRAATPLLAAAQILRADHAEFLVSGEAVLEQFNAAVQLTDVLGQAPPPRKQNYMTNPFALGLVVGLLDDIYYLKLFRDGQYAALDSSATLTRLLPAIARYRVAEYQYRQGNVLAYRQLTSGIVNGLTLLRKNDPPRAVHHYLVTMALEFASRHPRRYDLIDVVGPLYELAAESSHPNLSYVDDEAKSLLYCRSLNGLANLHLAGGRGEDAAAALKKVGLTLHQNPTLAVERTAVIMADSFYLQGRIAAQASEHEEAEKHLRVAFDLMREHGSGLSKSEDMLTMDILTETADVFRQTQNFERAIDQYRGNMKLIPTLKNLDDGDRLMFQVWNLTGKAKSHAAVLRPGEMGGDIEELIPLAKALYTLDPPRYLHELINAKVVESSFLELSENFEAANTAVLDARALMNTTPILNAERSATTAASLDHILGRYEIVKGNLDLAVTYFNQATEQLKPFFIADPNRHWPVMAKYSMSKIEGLNGQRKFRQATVVTQFVKNLLARVEEITPKEGNKQLDAFKLHLNQLSKSTANVRPEDVGKMLERYSTPK